MTVERGVRVLAGSFILISLGLGYFYSQYWYLMTTFVGLNLLQSGITGWCLAAILMQKLGLKQSDSGANCCL